MTIPPESDHQRLDTERTDGAGESGGVEEGTSTGSMAPRVQSTVAYRRCWFALAAIVIGLFPAAGFELWCRAIGWGDPGQQVGRAEFEGVRPLFVRDDDGNRFVTAENRLGYFQRDSFSENKPSNGKRIFVVGGSTVQGRPYSIDSSLTAWLEISLNLADDDSAWNVVNCGGVSYASYRLSPIVDEVLEHEPDLIVLMTGHNEFLEDRELERAVEAAPTFYSVRAIRRAFAAGETRKPRALLSEEVDALLDYRGGLEQYTLDPAWHRQVAAQYEANLRAMVHACRVHGVPLLLVRPVANLRDTPPFKVSHGPDWTNDDRKSWETLRADVRGCLSESPPRLDSAIATLKKILKIDPWYAGSWFELGRCYDAARQFTSAREAYQQALDCDVCPLRMTTQLAEVLQHVVDETSTPLIDAQTLIASRSRDGITDAQWMLDHVHPTIAGHQLIADEIAAWIVTQQTLAPRADWAASRESAYSEHLAGLSTGYFTEGARRLERLTNWARGRGEKIRGEEIRSENQAEKIRDVQE